MRSACSLAAGLDFVLVTVAPLDQAPEALVAKLDRFDCVTYVETVLALARAADPEGFVEELRLLRYEGGAVEWANRNHYMVGWARANSKRRAVWPVAAEKLAVKKERTLKAVPGLPPRAERFWCVPKSKLKAFAPRLSNGDVLLFASTKAGIDVFHCGLLVLAEGKRKLRHASRSAGSAGPSSTATTLDRAN